MKTTNPSNPRSSVLGCLAALGAFATLIQPVESSTITHAGTETSNGQSYPVHDWSNALVPKSHDSDGDNIYGTAGYWQIRPMPVDSGASVYEAVGANNSLGILSDPYPTLFASPAFLADITGGAGSYVNFEGYPDFRGPDGSTIFNQGALSVPVDQGPYNSPAGDNASKVGVPVQFTLGATGKFRIGLVVDAVADGNFAPDYVSIFSVGTGTVFSPALGCDGNPDMVFFDVTGDIGDTFVIGLWQNITAPHQYNIAPLSLITFDLLPDEPPPPPVLSYHIDNGNFVVSWPAETTGWTLESSTDLGGEDNWDPVPGVTGNSVAVPMTTASNFFRLRKDP
jgi:hypothetical protein